MENTTKIVILTNATICPIAMLVIGGMYFDKKYCPAEDIAVLLIVGGSISLVRIIIEIYKTIREVDFSDDAKKLVESLGFATLSAWSITACVVIYRLYPHVEFTEGSENYCNQTLYLFSFWLINSTFILAIIMMCLLIVCLICCKSIHADYEPV